METQVVKHSRGAAPTTPGVDPIGLNADLFVAIGEPIPDIPLDDQRLQDIEEAIERYGALQYDHRSQEERNHARLRILKLVLHMSTELKEAHDQIGEAAMQIESLSKEVDNLHLANKQLQTELPFNQTKPKP